MPKYIKTTSLMLVVAMLCICSATAQLKSFVCIVRGNYSADSIKFMEAYRDELQADGFSTYAKTIDGYLKGGFGSGFIYVADNGKSYVITNRHVIMDAENADIEFENEDGSTKKFEKLSILKTDDDIDLAILSFPSGINPFKQGLSFKSDAVTDGQDVWTAGFPGLNGDPVWQLGKGTVTNSAVRRKELLDPAISTLIQHSAQVDPGNSGGPLLVSSSKATAGYEVIGINTWKYSDRQDTNYSIPSTAVAKFIKTALYPEKTTDDSVVIKERTEKFSSTAADKDSSFTGIAKYVSYEYAASQGKKQFEKVLQSAPTSVMSTVGRAFSYSPIEGLRYAMAYKIWKEFQPADSKASAIQADIVSTEKGEGDTYLVSYKTKVDPIQTVNMTWSKEQGLWRISKFDINGKQDSVSSKKKDSNHSTHIEAPGNFYISGAFNHPLVTGYSNGFSLGIDWFKDDSLVGFGVGFNHESFDAAGDTQNIPEKSFSRNALTFTCDIQIPIAFSSIYLIPYAKGGIGVGLTSSSSDESLDYSDALAEKFLHTVFEGGFAIGPNNSWTATPLFFASYQFTGYGFFMSGSKKNSLNLGLSFCL